MSTMPLKYVSKIRSEFYTVTQFSCFFDEPCGPALFMPVQRIRQKYACSSVTLHGVKKLVSSPIPRVFH